MTESLNNMLKVILTRGIPGCGKTTWAKEEMTTHPGAYKRVNKDDLRAMLDDGRWSRENEKFVLALRDYIILEALKAGKSVIVDDTNLHVKHLAHIGQLVKDRAEVQLKDFTEVSVDECIKRDLKRPNSVGSKVIRQMHNQFLAVPLVKYFAGEDKDWIVICDLDGTMALLNGRNPYDASTCEQDLLNEPVAMVLRSLKKPIIFMSGREEKYREPTQRWLAKHDFLTYDLYMRMTGDKRRDSIVKEELFNEYVRGKYNVTLVLDDRNQVVSLWRSLGLTCLQVSDGDF